MPIYSYPIRLSDDAKMTQAKFKKKYCATFDYNRFSSCFSCTISVILNNPEDSQVLSVPAKVGKNLIITTPSGAKRIIEYRVTESGESPEAAFWHAYTVLGVNLRIW